MFTIKRSCQDISYFHKSLSHEYSIVNRHQWRFFTDTNTCTPRTSLPKHLDGEYRLYTSQEILPHTFGLLTFHGFASLHHTTLHYNKKNGEGKQFHLNNLYKHPLLYCGTFTLQKTWNSSTGFITTNLDQPSRPLTSSFLTWHSQ